MMTWFSTRMRRLSPRSLESQPNAWRGWRAEVAPENPDGPQDDDITLVACNSRFEVLWTYENRWNLYPRHSAYIPSVGDFDGDGRDEVNGGLFLLDHDGTVLWEQYLGDNMDSVLVEPWDDGSPPRAIVSAGGMVLDGTGQRLFELGMEEVPHGQEIRCGRYHADSADPELVIRHNGHYHPNHRAHG